MSSSSSLIESLVPVATAALNATKQIPAQKTVTLEVEPISQIKDYLAYPHKLGRPEAIAKHVAEFNSGLPDNARPDLWRDTLPNAAKVVEEDDPSSQRDFTGIALRESSITQKLYSSGFYITETEDSLDLNTEQELIEDLQYAIENNINLKLPPLAAILHRKTIDILLDPTYEALSDVRIISLFWFTYNHFLNTPERLQAFTIKESKRLYSLYFMAYVHFIKMPNKELPVEKFDLLITHHKATLNNILSRESFVIVSSDKFNHFLILYLWAVKYRAFHLVDPSFINISNPLFNAPMDLHCGELKAFIEEAYRHSDDSDDSDGSIDKCRAHLKLLLDIYFNIEHLLITSDTAYQNENKPDKCLLPKISLRSLINLSIQAQRHNRSAEDAVHTFRSIYTFFTEQSFWTDVPDKFPAQEPDVTFCDDFNLIVHATIRKANTPLMEFRAFLNTLKPAPPNPTLDTSCVCSDIRFVASDDSDDDEFLPSCIVAADAPAVVLGAQAPPSSLDAASELSDDAKPSRLIRTQSFMRLPADKSTHSSRDSTASSPRGLVIGGSDSDSEGETKLGLSLR